MAKNSIQPGRVLTVPAPTGGALSGAPVLIGTLFGVAQADAEEGADLEILTEGVVELAKATPLGIDVGDRLFWNDGDGQRADGCGVEQRVLPSREPLAKVQPCRDGAGPAGEEGAHGEFSALHGPCLKEKSATAVFCEPSSGSISKRTAS